MDDLEGVCSMHDLPSILLYRSPHQRLLDQYDPIYITGTQTRHFSTIFYIIFATVGLPTYKGMQFESLKAHQHNARTSTDKPSNRIDIFVIKTVVHSLSSV